MRSPVQTLIILFAYHYFVNDLGPRLMKDRKPFKLYYPMMLYNWLQIGINGWFVFKVVHDTGAY